jgi:hypothetical protein
VVVDTWHCPKCGMQLESSGVIVVNDEECSVFQCDTCTVEKPIFNEPFEVALTFAIDDRGKPFDPVDDEIF